MNTRRPSTRLTNASDAIAWQSCRRRAWFDLRESELALAPDDFERLIMQAGMEHERAVLANLGDYEAASDEAHTTELILAKTPVIYQPKFRDDALRVVAQPDFLFLEEEGYRAADAKLARSLDGKTDVRIQLAVYQRVISSNLSTRALLGGGETELISVKDLDRADEFLADMALLAETDRPQAHFGATKCGACPYRNVCVPEFQAAGDLGQNYFIDGRAIPWLIEAGVHTLRDLATCTADSLPDVPYFKGQKKSKAVSHAKALLTGALEIVSPLAPLPGTPVHFDIETNPLADHGQEEVYLWGFLLPPYSPTDFQYIWHDGGADNDCQAWLAFLNFVAELRKRHADAVLIHYARFERDVITRYSRKFSDTENPIVSWLLNGGGLVDLRERVVESLILPTTGYGLKEICKHSDLVNFQWELQESGSQWSVVRYHDFLEAATDAQREEIKQEILTYNRDDVRATRALEVWLQGLCANSS
ncbi:MAG: TM0106 family RecB-like putative nuclease [Woeseiaceae bacterium]